MNIIHNYARVLCVALLAVLTLSSCEDENYYTRDRLLGSWQVVETDDYYSTYYPGDMFYFGRNNRFMAYMGDLAYSGTYRVTSEYDGDVITVWYDDNPGQVAFMARIDALSSTYTRWYMIDYESGRQYTMRLVYTGG